MIYGRTSGNIVMTRKASKGRFPGARQPGLHHESGESRAKAFWQKWMVSLAGDTRRKVVQKC